MKKSVAKVGNEGNVHKLQILICRGEEWLKVVITGGNLWQIIAMSELAPHWVKEDCQCHWSIRLSRSVASSRFAVISLSVCNDMYCILAFMDMCWLMSGLWMSSWSRCNCVHCLYISLEWSVLLLVEQMKQLMSEKQTMETERWLVVYQVWPLIARPLCLADRDSFLRKALWQCKWKNFKGARFAISLCSLLYDCMTFTVTLSS